MIQLVTKEFFNKNVGKTDYDIVPADLEKFEIGKEININAAPFEFCPIYYNIPEYGYFVYLNYVPKVAIPKNNPRPIDVNGQIIQGVLDFSHWKLRLQELEDIYIVNEYDRIFRAEIPETSLKNIIPEDLPNKSTWQLYNTLTQETIRFNLWRKKDLFINRHNYKVMVPQVKQVPYNEMECNNRSRFVALLLDKHHNSIKWIK